jgi:hypothetical protein
MNSDLYREMYKFEWEQRTHLLSSINIPIAATVTLSTVLATMAFTFPYSKSSYKVEFMWTAILSLACLVTAIVFIFLSVLASEYTKIPPAGALRDHYKKLLQWHRNHGRTGKDARKDFAEAFDDALAVATDENSTTNRFRGGCVYLATVFLCCALIPLAVAGAFHVVTSIQKSETERTEHICNRQLNLD